MENGEIPKTQMSIIRVLNRSRLVNPMHTKVALIKKFVPPSPKGLTQGIHDISSYKILKKCPIAKEAVRAGQRTFATGAGKAKKGSKGAARDAPKASILSNDIKSATLIGANILKEGADQKTLPDSEYPDWIWHLLDSRPALSELRWKDIETLAYEDLKRFVKLDNRARIKENNSEKNKN